MSKKFSSKPPHQVNLPGRGSKTENPKNLNKKTKNIYKMLVEKGDDQGKTQQKNFKNKKSKTQIDDSKPDITKEMEEEIYKVKKMLQKCSSLMRQIKVNMESGRKEAPEKTEETEKEKEKEEMKEEEEKEEIEEEEKEEEEKEETQEKISNKLPKREDISNKFTTDEVNIAVVNSGGLNGKKESINNFINKYDIRICILSETHTAGK